MIRNEGIRWFISRGDLLTKVYCTEVAPEEYLAYRTEEREKTKLMQYAEKFGGDMQKAIAAMAKELKLNI